MNATHFRGVGFGGPPCDAHGIPTYQLTLPTIEIFNGVPGGVPTDLPGVAAIDLFEVQCRIFEDD